MDRLPITAARRRALQELLTHEIVEVRGRIAPGCVTPACADWLLEQGFAFAHPTFGRPRHIEFTVDGEEFGRSIGIP